MSLIEFMADSQFNLDTVFISPQSMLRENRSFMQPTSGDILTKWSIVPVHIILFSSTLARPGS